MAQKQMNWSRTGSAPFVSPYPMTADQMLARIRKDPSVRSGHVQSVGRILIAPKVGASYYLKGTRG